MKNLLLLLVLLSFNTLADELITLSFDKVTQFTNNTDIPEDKHKGYKVYVNGEWLVDLEPDELTYSQMFSDGIYVFTVTAIAVVEGEERESEHSNPATKTLPTAIPKAPSITVTVTVTVN